MEVLIEGPTIVLYLCNKIAKVQLTLQLNVKEVKIYDGRPIILCHLQGKHIRLRDRTVVVCSVLRRIFL